MLGRMSVEGLGRRRRAWIAIPIAMLLVLLFVGSRHERRARSRSGGEAESSARAVAVGARGATSATTARDDAGASEPVRSVRAPVRLSAPRVRRDEGAAAGVLAGRVLAFGSARPIAGAELTFARGGTTRSIRTDARGEFTFAPEEEGTYVLALATADGFLPFAPEWGHSPVRFTARAGARLEGVIVYLVDAVEHVALVVDEHGRAVEGARVTVLGADRGERALAPMASHATTDARGEARFTAPDGAVIEAAHPEHGYGRARLDASAQASHRVVIRLARGAAPARLRITGQVRGPDGEAIAGALVVARHAARPSSAEAQLHPVLDAASDDHGRFVLEPADEGSYRVIASAAGYARAVVERVEAGTDGLVMRLAREGRLLVRARDAETGEPVPALTVVVTRALGPLAEEAVAIESAYDADGEIEIGGLPEGELRVLATSPGYALSPPLRVAIVRGGEPAIVHVELDRGGAIAGRVVSARGGAPLEGARVTLEGAIGTGPSAVPLESSVLTDPDGRFRLAGVPPGARSIAVWAADHHGRLRSGLAVARGETLDVGTIDLQPVEEGERPGLELAGIGAVLSAEGDAMVIGQVIEGGGAAESGLVRGDAILEVDGVPVVELGFAGTIERIRGPEGTSVRLRVRRADGEVGVIVVPRRRVRA